MRFSRIRVTADRFDGSVFTGELVAVEGEHIEVEVVPLGEDMLELEDPGSGVGAPARQRGHRLRVEMRKVGSWNWQRSQ